MTATAPGAGRSAPGGVGDVLWLLGRARPALPRLLLAVLAATGATGSAVALLATSAWLISAAALHPPVLTLTVAVVSVRALGISRGVLRYAERLVSHDAALRAQARLRLRTYRELERIVPAGLGGVRTGDVLSRLVTDVESLADLLVRVLLPLASTALVAAATLALLLWLLPAAALAVLAALALALLGVPLLTAWVAARAERATAAAAGELSTRVLDVLHGADELLALAAAPAAMDAVADADRRLARLRRGATAAAGLGSGLTVAACGVAVLGCLLVGVPAVRSGQLDGVLLAVLVLTPIALWEAVTALPPALQRLPGLAASAARLRALAATPSPVPEPPPAPGGARPDGVASCGEPRLLARRLGLRWPGGDRDAVSGLDLDLRPGRTVALAGPSGSGKSTVVAALLRFLQPVSGELRYAGVEVRDTPAERVRGDIAWCGPDAHLFDTTVRQNLVLASPGATDEQVHAALAGARLAGWVRAQPLGLDTPVGEHGAALSGGERQRLGLARALLAERPVLVLDEPTAQLDGPTARALATDLAAAARGRTTLLVSHSADLLDAADQIVELRREAGPVTQDPR
jgi:thiol reductant ABC exporter CydC subunit